MSTNGSSLGMPTRSVHPTRAGRGMVSHRLVALLNLLLTLTPPLSTTIPVRAGDQRFGVNVGNWGPVTNDDYDWAQAMGVGVVRVALTWPYIEWRKGKYDWSSVDVEVRRAREHGMRPVAVYMGSARYASARANPPDLSICPPRPRLLQKFMKKVAQRYRGQVDVFEIWNEPDHPDFWVGPPDPAEYAEVLAAAYKGVKAVLFFLERDGGLSPDYPEQFWKYFGLLYEDGGWKPAAHAFRKAVLGG